nr:pectin acetylesterase 8-like [Ipomoea batatas]
MAETKRLLFFFLVFQLITITSNGLFVNPTLVQSDAGAVCLTGKPASYYFFQGFGNGIGNWIVYLPGGAWCATPGFCIQYAADHNITLDPVPFYFGNILDNDEEKNPDFFDWNKVVITYCDGSSFTGDSQTIYNGTNLYFRGARIFDAVMQELLQKGMIMAHNALLFGSSAGGVAATLHCDGFRNLLPYAIRVKCFSDAGYFFPSTRFEGNSFTPTFQGLITLHVFFSSFLYFYIFKKFIYKSISVRIYMFCTLLGDMDGVVNKNKLCYKSLILPLTN